MSYEHIAEQLVPPEAYRDIVVGRDVLHVISRERCNDASYHDIGRHSANTQRLIALGSYHINDPEHWHYEPAMAIFYDWEEATRGSKRVLIAEGDQDLWGLGETAGHAITEHYSTVGLQCLLSKMFDIPLISGEPPNYSDIGQLMLEFSPEDVLLHYGIIQIPLLYRMRGAEKPSLDEYMEGRMFPSYRRQLGKLALTLPDSHPLHGFDFSYSNFKNVYRSHFGDEPNAEDSEMNKLYLRITSPDLEPPEFANQPVARVGSRRRVLRYSHLGAVQAALWRNGVSSNTSRGIFHTMGLDDYFAQFGHSTRPPLRSWGVSSRTKSGYLLTRGGKSQDADYEWDPWDLSPAKHSEQSLPPYLFDPNKKPDEATKTRVKAYFSKRAAEPIGPSPYITHLTRPFEEWKAGFSTLCKELEVLADKLFPTFMTSYGRLKGATHSWHWREQTQGLYSTHVAPLFLDRDSHISDALLAACLRLNGTFCRRPSEYAPFNQRALQLFERFLASAQSAQQAVVAFDAASKHLTMTDIPAPFPGDTGLTPIERLHHCLETLEYELQKCR